MKSSSGQALLEALFVAVFTTIIMFCFLQVCITVVDDMTLNEAAFVGMRSAAVTKGGETKRREEAEKWIKNYLLLFYPFSVSGITSQLKGSFVFSNYKTVAPYYQNARSDNSNGGEEDGEEMNAQDDGEPVTYWGGSLGNIKDYSGRTLKKYTAKIYYYTKIMFGSIVSKQMSKRSLFGSNARYSSSRSRMIPSPDENYYSKAYPQAAKFKDYDLQSVIFGDD
ncbi:MAG: hypothetical protein LBO62_01020 [Endomicrobium sp.]|jgi:hypothetical protein|nr:hypothetical protein [Endomicrobium sp.]